MHHRSRAVNPFSHMAQAGHGLGQCLTLGQKHTHLAIAAEIASGREHQIAQTRQAGKGVGTCAQRHTQTRHFGQTAGDQSGPRIEPELQTVTKTTSYRQHVFNSAAHLYTHHVMAGVDTQGRLVKSRHQRVTHTGVFTGGHQRGRPAHGNFTRKTRPAQHAGSQAGSHLGTDFVGQ